MSTKVTMPFVAAIIALASPALGVGTAIATTSTPPSPFSTAYRNLMSFWPRQGSTAERVVVTVGAEMNRQVWVLELV